MTVSDQLHDLIIIRQLLLQRIIGGQDAAINKQLDALAASIQKALRGDDLTTYKGKRLAKAIDELKAMVSITPPDLADLAKAEASFLQSAFVSVGIDTVIPPASVVDTIAKSALIQGATIGEWFSRLNESARFDIERAIKNGVTLGQTNREIANAIVGNGSDKGPQALAKARRDAMAITRTGVQTIANEARMAGLMENQDIIKAVQWVSTLDSRTSDICIARSGKTWTFPEFKPIGHSIPWNGGPPAHWSCRSSYIPITKSFAEIRNEPVAKEISQTTRASMDGQVAADLSFDQFLKNKPASFADEMLGKGKAELWRSGKITFSQLLDQRGNPLTLSQLQSRYGAPMVAPKPIAAPQPRMGDIDKTIADVKAFKFVPEYEATKARMSAEGKALDEAAKDFYATGSRDAEKRKIAIAAQDTYNETVKKFRALEVMERDRMVRILALPNEMRGNPNDVVISGYNASYRKSVTDASSLVSMLVHRDIMPTGIKVNGVRGKRAYYQSQNRAIHMNKDTSVSVIVHEIVHDIEYSHPDVSRKTKAFLAKRANGEQPKQLRALTGGKFFGRDEVAYEDEWKKRGGSHYMGKVYQRASTELLTMGIERMLADAKSFAEKDPEYFRFMLEILRRVD